MVNRFTSSDHAPPQSRVLVVDDEFANRVLLERIIQQQSEVASAESGQQALEMLEQESFDLILLDIMMPHMNGLEVLQKIRSTPATAELPVILISALSQNEDVVRGLQMGANDYITKPIDFDVVVAHVETHLKLKHMLDTYRQSIVELQSAQQLKDRLFRIAAHDLKSPLSNVSLAETLLRDFVGDNPMALEILDTLEETVKTMKAVIEEFLEVAVVQSSGIEIHFAPVDVRQLAMSVTAQYSMSAHEKNITLDLEDLPGTIRADSERMTQVLSNLVSNALKYSPLNTTVTIWSEDRGDTIRIHVADQGPGIPVDERQRLFTEFGKLSTRPTGNESSTGLGLWIVKHMVTLQNGTVGVDCPDEGGSIFWAEFPRA